MVPNQSQRPHLRGSQASRQDLQSLHDSSLPSMPTKFWNGFGPSKRRIYSASTMVLDILKAYLKTQHEPKAAIETLEGRTVEQHISWKKAVDRIKKLLD